MRQNTEMIAQGLKGALEHEFHQPLSIFWTVDASLAVVSPKAQPSPKAVLEDEVEGDDAVVVVDSAAGHLIAEMFPGTEEIS